VEFICNPCEKAEYPTPDVKKKISDGAQSKEKRKGKARQENDHEDCKDQSNPDDIEGPKERSNEFQELNINFREVLKT
jgi:hypothetical protein